MKVPCISHFCFEIPSVVIHKDNKKSTKSVKIFLENQIRGLNEDESQFLQVLKTAEQNEINARHREEEILFNQLRRNQVYYFR